MKKLRFALFGNTYQAKKSTSVQKILTTLEQHEAQILIDREFHQYLTQTLQINVPPVEIIDGDTFAAHFAISMGGDGTFLETARRVGDKQIPILGINMGRLGFLSDFQADDIDATIDSIYTQTYKIEHRTVLQVSPLQLASHDISPYALNEIAVLKHDISSMISTSYPSPNPPDDVLVRNSTIPESLVYRCSFPNALNDDDIPIPAFPHILSSRSHTA